MGVGGAWGEWVWGARVSLWLRTKIKKPNKNPTKTQQTTPPQPPKITPEKVYLLGSMCHPNIMRFLAVVLDPPMIVMQYYPAGSLFELLRTLDTALAVKYPLALSSEKRALIALKVC